MAKKKDPSVTYLNQFGYNVVKLPRVGIEPMDVVGKDDATQWLGPLRAVWTSSAPEPVVSAPRPAVQVIGQKTDQLDFGFGAKILANALAAFGATVPSVDFAFQRARKIQFSYTNVTSTSVAPLDAGNYLTNGKLNSDNPVVRHYFTGQESQAFLIVDVLKSDSITVTATDDHGVTIGVDVPAIEGVVGANVKVKPSGGSNSTITFTGPQAVTFGFIVDEIEYDGSKWSLTGATASGDKAFGAAAGSEGGFAQGNGFNPILLSSACTIRL
jgi:hypothetical protein